jgi:hypothetical protein
VIYGVFDSSWKEKKDKNVVSGGYGKNSKIITNFA